MKILNLKKLTRLILVLSVISFVGLIISRFFTSLYASTRTYSMEKAPKQPVAIVFGAGLRRDGTPTMVLRERITTAVELYKAGKVKKLLLSGDNRYDDYNEPEAMRQYALSLGVPNEDMVLDYAGRRSYDTCYRARHIFNVRNAILITQPFHLPRALYTCNSLGVAAIGIPANQLSYRPHIMAFWNLRESLATVVALWEVNISHPVPVLGQPEPIFPYEV